METPRKTTIKKFRQGPLLPGTDGVTPDSLHTYLDTLWHTMLCMQPFEHTLRGSGLSALPALVDTVQCDPKTLDDGLRGTVHGTLRKNKYRYLC